jgi:hypothetical protein
MNFSDIFIKTEEYLKKQNLIRIPNYKCQFLTTDGASGEKEKFEISSFLA